MASHRRRPGTTEVNMSLVAGASEGSSESVAETSVEPVDDPAAAILATCERVLQATQSGWDRAKSEIGEQCQEYRAELVASSGELTASLGRLVAESRDAVVALEAQGGRLQGM